MMHNEKLWHNLNIFRRLAVWLFGWDYVVLVDKDGDYSVRRMKSNVHWDGTILAITYRWNLGEPRIILYPNGKVSGLIYVKEWHPITKGAIKHYEGVEHE